jgi:hypothetical protein
MILHVPVCPEREDEPHEIETQNHVYNNYRPNTLAVAQPATAHPLGEIKVFVSLKLSFQVKQISIFLP